MLKNKKDNVTRKSITNFRNNLGITLIALVITIIVLLILAGVTLSLTLGENGLLRRSQEAEGEYTKSSIKEELEMDITDMLIQNKGETLTKQEIADNIVNKVTITDVTDDIIEGEYKDYGIIIDENNNVIVGDKLVGEIPKVEITVLDTEVGIEKTTLQVIASTTDGEIESIEPMNGAVLKTENSNADKIYEVDKNGEYRFKVRGTNKRSAIGTIVVDNLMIEIDSESLLKGITELEGGGLARINVQGKLDNGTETKETYQVNITEYNKDLVLDGITPVVINSKKTITPNDNKTYEFGDLKDVATSTEMAQNTAVLKVNGNLTINEGVKVTTIASPNGYGGPKGMVIYCTGELINNGEISMTARGAKAVGQDVYLWRNASGNYEYVSKAGAIGGAKYNNSGRNTYLTGSTGVSGTLRQTGGGGSGGTLNGSEGGGYTIGREGGTGTSYSGGPGSGGISCDNRESTNAQIPEENGGAGGNGRAYRTYNMWTDRNAAGGTGNPGGLGGNHSESGGSIGNSTKLKGNNGTGGLLVIFSSVFTNNGLITSMGTDSVNVGSVSGGASGAGSVNVFYNQLKNIGEFNVSGGKSVNYGGAGGNGTTTIGRIEAGTFVKE